MIALEDITLVLPMGTMRLFPNTYETIVCDYCGRRKKCDMWENIKAHVPGGEWIYIDLCRTCSRKLAREASS